MAIILSGVVVLMIMGHYSFFGHPDGALDITRDWAAIGVTALVCGLLGGFFSRLLIKGSQFLSPYAKEHPYRVVVLCALCHQIFTKHASAWQRMHIHCHHVSRLGRDSAKTNTVQCRASDQSVQKPSPR